MTTTMDSPHGSPSGEGRTPAPGTRTLANAALTSTLAADALAARVHGRLIAFARKLTAGDSAGRDYDPVALIDDAYQKVCISRRGGAPVWETAAQFWDEFVITLRHLLVDHARARLRKRRYPGRPHDDPAALDAHCVFDADPALVLDTAAALDALAARDRQGHQVVVLRQYGQMSNDMVAAAIGLTPWQAKAKWQTSVAFLRRELKAYRPPPQPDGEHPTGGTSHG